MLDINHLSKSFGQAPVVDDVSLKIAEGSFVSFLGPSGSGKTTVLRMISGFESPSSGEILFKGQRINDWTPQNRPFHMVFQKPTLFPHLNVSENIAYGLKLKKTPLEEMRKRVQEMLHLINMDGLQNRMPETLSGGQAQRVSIARSLVMNPEVLLLDEPLSALDLKLKQRLVEELRQIHRHLKKTFIYVTHDQTEAMTLSDQVALFEKGRVVEYGSPESLYRSPRHPFTAQFIGDGYFFNGKLQEKNGHVEFQSKELICRWNQSREDLDVGRKVRLFVRPEHLRLVREMRPENSWAQVTIKDSVFLGQYRSIEVSLGERQVHVRVPHFEDHFHPGDRVQLDIDTQRASLFLDTE